MIKTPSATIYDVADHAAVSISTVSRYLNNPDKVNTETGSRIKAAIESLSYIRHGNAGSKLSRQTGRIGVLAPFFPAPSFIERMEGMTPVFHAGNCEMLIHSIDSPQRLNHFLQSVSCTKRLDGIIVIAMRMDDHQANHLHRSGLQVVLIEQSSPLFCSIECDNVRGGALAAEYLLSKEYWPMSYLGQDMALPYSLQPSALRIKGFSETLKNAGHELDPANIRLGEVSVEGGITLATQLLRQNPRPRSIFAMSDLQAIGAIKAARKLGLRVPEDIAILGFDDIEAADYMELTTISQSLKESGRLAAELLIGRIREPQRPLQNIQLRVSVIERATT